MKTTLLKEWNAQQFKNAEKQIFKFLSSRFFESHQEENKHVFIGCKNYTEFSNVCGLAYTSSGDFAGLWVCNISLFLDTAQVYKIDGFAQDSNGFVYAYCTDNEEKELLICIN